MASIPWADDVVDAQTDRRSGRKSWTVSRAWGNFFLNLLTQSDATARTVASASLTAQSASIGTTALLPTAASGLYRVSWRFRLSTAAAVNSSLLITITSTDNAVACSQVTTAYVGNVTNAPQSGEFLVQADPATPISYATTYVSVGVPAMVYEIQLVAELVQL